MIIRKIQLYAPEKCWGFGPIRCIPIIASLCRLGSYFHILTTLHKSKPKLHNFFKIRIARKKAAKDLKVSHRGYGYFVFKGQ